MVDGVAEGEIEFHTIGNVRSNQASRRRAYILDFDEFQQVTINIQSGCNFVCRWIVRIVIHLRDGQFWFVNDEVNLSWPTPIGQYDSVKATCPDSKNRIRR